MSEDAFSFRFSEKDVRRFAQELYGIRAAPRPLVSEMDQNFYLKDETGKEYVFRIENPSRSRDFLDLQNKAVEFLSANNKALNCPRVCKNLKGERISAVKSKAGKEFYARLLTYIKGKFLADVDQPSPQLFRKLGGLIGSMDQILSQFHHPAAYRELAWDLRNTLQSTARISFIKNPQRKRLVEHFLLQFETRIVPLLPSLRTSLIHNDINDYNILVEKLPSGEEEIAGIIDFGDMVQTCTVFEPAIALTYAMLGKDDPLEIAASIVGGYHEIFPLTETEIGALFYLICARLCISVTMSALRKKAEPENRYLTISEKPAWVLLERLLEMNPEKADKAFREACGFAIPPRRMKATEILKIRQRYIGKSLSIFYKKPLHIVGGAMQYLYDEEGRTYLDCVNNVCHVGHCHPRVVKAAQHQMAELNTNTRYLHENLVKYAQRLSDLMPDPLSVCFIVNSGSEANDLALRLARTYTGQKDIIVVDGAYHGHLTSLIEISPYKFNGLGGRGASSHIWKVPTPDIYRGMYRADKPDAGEKYAAFIQSAIEDIVQQDKNVAAFICESLMGCAGQIVYPEGYLKKAFQYVSEAGGVCIADEVQVGFGRMGTHFWGFETQDVVPDIVTLGKPIGNGHPLAAVVTTAEIADAFDNGMEYFNTFGGNPVSCAVGLAVLDVIRDERLQENAFKAGKMLKTGLEELKSKHEIIGDVRGMGLFLGVELVRDQDILEPAAEEAREIIERMKELGILLSIDGPLANVLKIKPPLVFTEANVDLVLHSLDEVLSAV